MMMMIWTLSIVMICQGYAKYELPPNIPIHVSIGIDITDIPKVTTIIIFIIRTVEVVVCRSGGVGRSDGVTTATADPRSTCRGEKHPLVCVCVTTLVQVWWWSAWQVLPQAATIYQQVLWMITHVYRYFWSHNTGCEEDLCQFSTLYHICNLTLEGGGPLGNLKMMIFL